MIKRKDFDATFIKKLKPFVGEYMPRRWILTNSVEIWDWNGDKAIFWVRRSKNDKVLGMIPRYIFRKKGAKK